MMICILNNIKCFVKRFFEALLSMAIGIGVVSFAALPGIIYVVLLWFEVIKINIIILVIMIIVTIAWCKAVFNF